MASKTSSGAGETAGLGSTDELRSTAKATIDAETGGGAPGGAAHGSDAGALSQARDKAGEAVGQAVGQVQEKAGAVAGQLQEKATTQLDAQKVRATESLGGVAQALHQTGDQLNQGQGPLENTLAQYSHIAAQEVERVSNYLRDKSTGELLGELEGFARREPALFLGGAFLLGIIGARFLKSSGQTVGGGGYSTTGNGSQPAVPAASDGHSGGY